MKLTTKQLRNLIKEELASVTEGLFGGGAEEGSKEAVIAQIENIQAIASDLLGAVEELLETAMSSDDLVADLDDPSDDGRWSKRVDIALDKMEKVARAAKRVSEDEDFANIGHDMSPI